MMLFMSLFVVFTVFCVGPVHGRNAPSYKSLHDLYHGALRLCTGFFLGKTKAYSLIQLVNVLAQMHEFHKLL